MDIQPNHQPEQTSGSPPEPSNQFTPPVSAAPAQQPPVSEPMSPPAPADMPQVVSYSDPIASSASTSSEKPYVNPFDDVVDAPATTTSLNPQPVVHVLSPRGVEYVFLTIALFTGAIGLITTLISLVNGQTGFDVLSFPISLLIVAVPVFAWLFLRLKNAEVRDPSLALDASKRRSTQVIQIVMFMVCFFTLIGFVGAMLGAMSGNLGTPIGKIILDVLSILVVSGGVLFYYWRDEHRAR